MVDDAEIHDADGPEDEPEHPDWLHRIARAPEETPPWMPAKGDIVAGKYRVEERIGEGGLGAVYRAYDTTLDRPVALKLMRKIGESDTFEKEARATARVSHPNVVTIFAHGRENGTPYLVLELLDGESLGDRARREEISLAEALAIASDVAAAVTAAHLRSVTHRDLSPHNIFCGKDGQTKVLDFGFATLERALRTQRSARARDEKSQRREAGGTMGFMDPRQWDGTDEPRASDLFGLGAIVFWLVARRPPYEGASLHDYVKTAAAGGAPRLRDLHPAVPRDLDDLVAALLDPDPKRRPPAEEARDRLRAAREEVEDRLSPGQRPRRRRAKSTIEDPFRPLTTFSVADADLFFGRHQEIEELSDLVRAQRIVVLHGVSGAGKSSLLEAGLRPAIEHQMRWVKVPPAANAQSGPLESLVARVRAEIAKAGETAVGSEPESLLRTLAKRSGRPVLVVLDQFEEVFQRGTEQEIERVCEALGQALRRSTTGNEAVHVLFSVRGDYFGHLRHLQGELRGIFEHGLLLQPLGEDATSLAIEMPFELAGFEIPRGLGARLRKDLTDRGRVSPVELQLVCQALYENAKKSGERAISEEAYNTLGGAGKVLARHLAKAESKWSADTLATVWPLLRQLVSKDGTRAPAKDVDVLVAETGIDEQLVRPALAQLVEERIVQPLERESDGSPVQYRIAHDRMGGVVWERLSEEDRRGVAARELLKAEMAREPRDALGRAMWLGWTMLSDVRATLIAWHAEGAVGATDTERAFLRRLVKWDRHRRRGPLYGAAAGLALVASLVAYVVVQQKNLREEKARAADANAERELKHDPGKALAWIAEAARLRGGFENEDEASYHQHWLWAGEAWRASTWSRSTPAWRLLWMRFRAHAWRSRPAETGYSSIGWTPGSMES